MTDLDPVWNLPPIVVEKPSPPPVVSKVDEADEQSAKETQEYKGVDSAAVEAEKDAYKTYRSEGKSIMQAAKMAAQVKRDLLLNYVDGLGSAEVKADKKDPDKFWLRVVVYDYDLIGDDDFMGDCQVSKRELFTCGQMNHKQYFPITGEMGEGRKRKPATGKVSVMVRLHEWTGNDWSRFGTTLKVLMTGEQEAKELAMEKLIGVFCADDVLLMTRFQDLVDLFQEPMIEELVCCISDPSLCERACKVLVGVLGDRSLGRKSWGFSLRRSLQERIVGAGGADASAENVLGWDLGSGRLRRKAACLEVMVGLFEDNSSLMQGVVGRNHKVLIAVVAGLEVIQKEHDIETADETVEDEMAKIRIGIAARQLLKEVQYKDELSPEVLKAIWRVRRYIPLEEGLWKSPALKAMGNGSEDMPGDDECPELHDIKKMRRSSAWAAALKSPSFWFGVALRISAPVYPLILIGSGSGHYSDYCSEDLAGLLIGEGCVLFIASWVGLGFEFCVRYLKFDKGSFVFVVCLFLLGVVHFSLWGHGFTVYESSFPSMDFTWTLTSYDERHAEHNKPWGAPSPAPSPAPTYDGVGCQEGLLDTFVGMQWVTGVVSLGWLWVLWKMATFTPNAKKSEDGREKALEELKGKEKAKGQKIAAELVIVQPGPGSVDDNKKKPKFGEKGWFREGGRVATSSMIGGGGWGEKNKEEGRVDIDGVEKVNEVVEGELEGEGEEVNENEDDVNEMVGSALIEGGGEEGGGVDPYEIPEDPYLNFKSTGDLGIDVVRANKLALSVCGEG